MKKSLVRRFCSAVLSHESDISTKAIAIAGQPKSNADHSTAAIHPADVFDTMRAEFWRHTGMKGATQSLHDARGEPVKRFCFASRCDAVEMKGEEP